MAFEGRVRPPAGNIARPDTGQAETAWGDFFQRLADSLSTVDESRQATADLLADTNARLAALEARTARVGDYLLSANASPPDKFLPANGGAISRSTYAELFAMLGTSYGAGNGTTTFNVPKFAPGLGAFAHIRVLP